ncbi:MAG: ABC transporter ATP-binding protein [Acidobacteria bacterium]|nr:ABC transporter ATP-binding protein [Acidobacteriota bacterium]
MTARAAAPDGHAAETIAGISLSVPAGAIVAVLGPNGSGKTTLIRLLSGALAPRSGEIAIDGQPLARFSRAALARRVAVVPQETHLAFDYTVLEIVLMGRYPRLRAFQIERPEDIASALGALAATGTRPLADRAFPTLSGGEKQRVIIASALAQLDNAQPGGAAATDPPALLFLDEPTASLDLRYQLELAGLLTDLNRRRGLTMLLSTHDLGLARSIATHAVLLARGRVLAEGPPAAVLTADLVGRLYDLDPALVAPALR